jgi:hypothetical protein
VPLVGLYIQKDLTPLSGCIGFIVAFNVLFSRANSFETLSGVLEGDCLVYRKLQADF